MKINKPFTKLFDHPFLSNMVEETINLYNRFNRSKEVIKEFYGVDIGEVKLPIKPIFRPAKKRHLALNERYCKACGIQSYLIKDIGTMYNRMGTMHRAQADYEAVSTALRTAKFNKELVIVGDTIGFKNPESATSIRTDIYPDRKTMQIDVVEKFLTLVHSLIFFERLFPDQKFVKYFQGKRFFAFHERNETSLDQLVEYGHPTIERLNYLYWKHNFKDFVDYAGLVEKNCCDFVGETCGLRPSINRDSCFENHCDHYEHTSFQEDLRISLYRLYWGIEYRAWDRQFKLSDGTKVNLTLHNHEILGFGEIKIAPPKTIYEHPNEHYKEILDVLFERKLKNFYVKQDFKSIVLSELKSHQDQIVPIENNLDLIREGSIMSHCIGGEEYINEGLSKQHIYFRFIPEGVSRSDTMNHFTVTLSNLQPINRFVDPSVVVDSDVYHYYNAGFHGYRNGFWRYVQDGDNGEKFKAYSPVEIWGWNNAVPSKKEIKQIYQFIWNNQYLFRCKDE